MNRNPLKAKIIKLNPIIIGLNLICFLVNGQNLVPNPSFETYAMCPTSSGQITYSTNWISPTLATPDYYNSCSSVVGVPVQGSGLFQNASTGNAFAGIWCYYDAGAYREYIQTMLIDTLKFGDSYNISFKVNLMNGCQYSIATLGLVLSNSPISSGCSTCVLSYSPQIENPFSNILSDTLIWATISGTYIANGGEKYITIGNFRTDANSNVVADSNGIYDEAYYFIDDVQVYPDSVTSVTQLKKGPHISLYPNPAKDELFISVNDKEIKSAFVEITDITGKVVYSSEITTDEMVGKLNLNIDNGVYLVNIIDSDTKKKSVQKIVINK